MEGIEILVGMGCEEREAEKALEAHNGDVQAAANELLEYVTTLKAKDLYFDKMTRYEIIFD